MAQMLDEGGYIPATIIIDEGPDGLSIVDVVVVGLGDADMPLLRRTDNGATIRLASWWSLKRRMSDSEKRRFTDLHSACAEFDRFAEALQIGQSKPAGSNDWPFRRHLQAALNRQAATTANREPASMHQALAESA